MTPNVSRLTRDAVEALADDTEFGNHPLDGLVFAAPDRVQVVRVPRAVPTLAIAADSFHTKPLRRLLQTTGRYQVLALSRQSLRLDEGNREALDEIEPAAGVPRTLIEALGSETTMQNAVLRSYSPGVDGSSGMRQGGGGHDAEVDLDTERFFRAVDRAVLEHHALFRQVSHDPRLVGEGIAINPGAVPHDELRDRAWQVFEPAHRARRAALADEFHAARA